MEYLTTEQFARRAQGLPEACRRKLTGFVRRSAAGAAPVAEPFESYLVGRSRQGGQGALWFLVDERELGPVLDEPPPLASMSRAALRRLGVPDELIPAVQRVRTLPELGRLGLSAELGGALRFRFVEQATGLGARPSELVRRAPDLDHLERYLRGDITELLLHLDGTQRRISELGGTGPIVVRGVAGSGKTAVALHRIHHLLRQRSLLETPRLLFLTYNRSLAGAARELLYQGFGLGPADVEVETLHAFCRRLVGWQTAVLDATERLELIAAARREVQASFRRSALWSYPEEFWDAEIHLIKSRVTGGRPAYLSLARLGAGRPLDAAARGVVWAATERYETLCAERGVMDWDDVVRRALDALEDCEGRYDHVFVDEAQDLTVLALRLAGRLVRPGGSLLVAYDRAQSIYEKSGFAWKDCGIGVHGSRSFDLTRNHRNTLEILEAARPLWARLREAGQEGEQLLEPAAVERRGPAPRLLPTAAHGEYEAAAVDIVETLRGGRLPPQNIAVLCFPNHVREGVAAALAAAGVRSQEHSSSRLVRLTDPSVKLLPVKSAKGLEFPVVYLMASAAWFRAPSGLSAPEERAAWRANLGRLFYMAMTRAMTNLILVYDRDAPVEYIRHLLPERE